MTVDRMFQVLTVIFVFVLFVLGTSVLMHATRGEGVEAIIRFGQAVFVGAAVYLCGSWPYEEVP